LASLRKKDASVGENSPKEILSSSVGVLPFNHNREKKGRGCPYCWNYKGKKRRRAAVYVDKVKGGFLCQQSTKGGGRKRRKGGRKEKRRFNFSHGKSPGVTREGESTPIYS